jgi:hypothetical protein
MIGGDVYLMNELLNSATAHQLEKRETWYGAGQREQLDPDDYTPSWWQPW